jgi:hypothetical protein
MFVFQLAEGTSDMATPQLPCMLSNGDAELTGEKQAKLLPELASQDDRTVGDRIRWGDKGYASYVRKP